MSSKDTCGDKGANTGKRAGGNKKMSGDKLSTGSKGPGGGKKAAGRPHRGGKTKSQVSSRQRDGRTSHRGASFDASALEGAEFIEVSNVVLPLDAGLENPASEANRLTSVSGASEAIRLIPVPRAAGAERPTPAAPATPPASAALAEGSHAESLSRTAIAAALGVAPEDIASFSLVKRSVDARKKSNVHFNATYAVRLARGMAYDVLSPARGVNVRAYEPPAPLTIPDLRSHVASSDGRIVVAGTGPAGLFCALYLAEAGLRPLVVERGAAVDERTAAIESFNVGGPLDAAANVQFGEGGAGTFSDGKLTTGTKSPHIRHVLEAFVQAGAPDEILWQAKPHIGTDKLPAVVKSIRERIIAAGGEVRFLTRLADIELAGGAVRSVVLEDSRTGAREAVEASRVIVACGHSARDIFELARDRGFALERKPFSMGVRIEHPQSLINRAQYGAAAKHAALGAADYKMAVRVPVRTGDTHADVASENATRGVYTFCMCPGGEVVAAASEEGGVVVNGMSRFARDGENSNSALLADVRPDDLPGDDVMEGVRLQREVERAAFELARRNGGAPYAAPAQTVGDFLSGATSSSGQAEGKQPGGTVAAASEARCRTVASESRSRLVVRPSYPRGVVWCDLRECLPAFTCDALAQGLPLLDAKLHGFADPAAVLTGPETRSSSPIRMVRGKNFQARWASDSPASDEEPATRVDPCGEGAGYAGGIMSAAVDGLRVAEAIAAELSSR